MKRGDLVTIALGGDMGKPRPALVIQSDDFAELATIVVIPVTSDRTTPRASRIDAPTTAASGLRKPSQLMVDKIVAIPRAKVGARIGVLEQDVLNQVERALAAFLGLA